MTTPTPEKIAKELYLKSSSVSIVADIAAAIRAERERARIEVLEEAAKICDDLRDAEDIAKIIRARITELEKA